MGLLDGILSNVAGSVLGGGQAQGGSPLDALVNSLDANNQKGTPNGQVPDNHNDLLSQGLALLKR